MLPLISLILCLVYKAFFIFCKNAWLFCLIFGDDLHLDRIDYCLVRELLITIFGKIL
ncbi:unnamed protein product [Meloidogyne enterolobii]|uniref:Uncharacterized protein n=1 Tax=Meloidogyne enterolobii TaxID=390850 RepID=A0ACB0YAW4_MELEN